MIDKSTENAPKSDAFSPTEEDEIEVANFKLLYRTAPTPERGKSSGASSDEETISSSLVPIPDTLRQMRNKLKRTVSDAEYSDSPCNGSEILEKPTGNVRESLEKLRKKYTLEDETSVALKMNSANLILDDFLNSANLNVTEDDDLQSRLFKQDEVKSKILSENETSITESSVSVTKHHPHVLDHSHSIAYDFYPPLCPRHGTFAQPLLNPPEKEEKCTPPKKFEYTQTRKTLMERLQDLQIKGKIQSVYRSLQRTRNPFAKSRKEPEVIKLQHGIPGVGYPENERLVYKCDNCHKCLKKHYPKVVNICNCGPGDDEHATEKRLNLDLVESSELSQAESQNSEREARLCTCLSQRECDCPEVIPKCNCVVMPFKIASKTSQNSTLHSEVPTFNEHVHETQSNGCMTQKKEDESSILLHKDDEVNEDKRKTKTNSLRKHFQESKKYCSKERRIIERTDIYYFDHGNSAYYQTTDHHPIRYTECLVERTDHYATKFWAEFFGTIEIGAAFLISFFLQFYRFLFTSIIRSLTVGLLQIFSDYFFKPLLTIVFNGIIQPCLILGYNVSTSVRDLCQPISQTFGFFAKEVAGILQSCRLVEVNNEKKTSCHCGNKV